MLILLRKLRRVIMLGFVVCCLAHLERIATAGISAPISSAVYSSDAKRVLVMVSPHPAYDNTPDTTLPDGRVVHIRDTFAKSGVYDTTTLAPLWQVDWYSLSSRLLWSADFRYVVRLNIHGIKDPWALSFYDQGVLVKMYDCNYLLTNLRHKRLLPFETWDWHARWYDQVKLNPVGNAVQLSTARREVWIYGHKLDLGLEEFYEFDLATGAMLSRRVTGAWVVWIYGALGVIIPLGFALCVTKLWKLLKRMRSHRGFPVMPSK